MKISPKHRKEIRQGFRTAGNLLLGFLTVVLVCIGAIGLSGGDVGRLGKPGAYIAFAAAVAILFVTAERWKTWIAGFFGVPGVLNALIMLQTGHLLNSPDKPIARVEAVGVLAFCIGLVILTYPSKRWRAPFDLLNRICVVAAAVAFWFAAVNQNRIVVLAWLVVCLGLFGMVRLRAELQQRRTHARSQ